MRNLLTELEAKYVVANELDEAKGSASGEALPSALQFVTSQVLLSR